MTRIKIPESVEPAHPMLVQRYDDFVEIYRYLKEKKQNVIDSIFDKVSKQIGFVVTTTLPVTLKIAAAGKIEKIEFSTANLQETLFGQEFKKTFSEMIETKETGIKASVGIYPLLFLWHEALKLKLKTDWMEPAHITVARRASVVAESLSTKLNPGVREPAHWFNSALSFENEDEILIAAIDEVYTDLKLAERVAIARRETSKYIPGVREPAHFRRIDELLEGEDAAKLLTELTTVLKKYGL